MLALIHDWLNQLGGAEDVLAALVDLYPDAPLYTSLYDRDRMPAHWREWDIRTAFIDRLPFAHRKPQLYFPLYPFAFEQFDLRGYDVVLSNKSGFCHGVITGPETVSYTHLDVYKRQSLKRVVIVVCPNVGGCSQNCNYKHTHFTPLCLQQI